MVKSKDIVILGRPLQLQERSKAQMKGVTIGDSLAYKFYDGEFHGMSLLFAEPKGKIAWRFIVGFKVLRKFLSLVLKAENQCHCELIHNKCNCTLSVDEIFLNSARRTCNDINVIFIHII